MTYVYPAFSVIAVFEGDAAAALQRLAELSVALAMLWLLYLIVKQIVSTLPKRELTNNNQSWASDIAVLKSEMGALKETVVPLSELVGDVKVLLDAIDDLRARVRDLESARRREGDR